MGVETFKYFAQREGKFSIPPLKKFGVFREKKKFEHPFSISLFLNVQPLTKCLSD